MNEEKYNFKPFIEANSDGSEPFLIFYLGDSYYRRIRIPLSGGVVEIPTGEVDSIGRSIYKLDNLTTIEYTAKEKKLI